MSIPIHLTLVRNEMIWQHSKVLLKYMMLLIFSHYDSHVGMTHFTSTSFDLRIRDAWKGLID